MGYGKIWAMGVLALGLSTLSPSQTQARGMFVCGTKEAVTRAEAEQARAAMLTQRVVITDDGRLKLVKVTVEQPDDTSLFGLLADEMRDGLDAIRSFATKSDRDDDLYGTRRAGC